MTRRCGSKITMGDQDCACGRLAGHLGLCRCRVRVYRTADLQEHRKGGAVVGTSVRDGARALGTIEVTWPQRLVRALARQD